VDSALGTFHPDKQPENLCNPSQPTYHPNQVNSDKNNWLNQNI